MKRVVGTRSVVFGATTCGTVALTLFAISIWGFGLGTLTSRSTERPLVQAATPATRPVTWEAVRSIIAKQLNVPEERVTPGSRLREDLNAKADDVAQITSAVEEQFGIVSEPPDDEVIFTAQDAFEFAQSPETFRGHWPKSSPDASLCFVIGESFLIQAHGSGDTDIISVRAIVRWHLVPSLLVIASLTWSLRNALRQPPWSARTGASEGKQERPTMTPSRPAHTRRPCTRG